MDRGGSHLPGIGRRATLVRSCPLADTSLLTTPLDALHRELGAKMVEFAGYAMPVQYPAGILAEHLHCRAAAALFDVSHMGQASLHGATAAQALEALVRQSGLAAMIATHNYELAARMDRRVTIEDGKVVEL